MKYERVLLISIDALGRKYLPLFKGFFNTVYHNYRVTHTWTLPGHVAMLSGINMRELYHVFDTKRLDRWKDCVKRIPTIATTFHSHGFRTRAIASGGYLSRYFGWGHDWDEWRTPEDGHREWNGEKMMPRKREFLFLHTYYVHNWFQATDELSRWFKKNGQQFKVVPYDVSLMGEARREYERRVRVLADRLSWIGSLPDDILVIFTADHGEIFSIDGKHFHHGDMARNDPNVYKVPLLLRTKSKKRHYQNSQVYDLSLRALIEREVFGT
ncbi:sulfatase-like hydrolase/transferase [Candidatus Gottesmanbacteria bacterium]|nr:sulfatase-like hydrolase/transferase [Candidatus Gottesmanbacteria bacterium]